MAVNKIVNLQYYNISCKKKLKGIDAWNAFQKNKFKVKVTNTVWPTKKYF